MHIFLSLKVIFVLSELENVDLLQDTSSINLTLTNQTTVLGPITFDNNQERSFMHVLIGLQCNGSWAIFKYIVNSVVSNSNSSSSCINYPSNDSQVVADDSGT